MTAATRRAATIALAAIVVAWWHLRLAPGGHIEPLDTLLYFFPSYARIAEHLRAGELPLWNPYQLCGIPWIGTLQAGVFYPTHLLYAALPLHQAYALGGVLHLLLATLATAAFVSRLGLGAGAAVLAAVVFGLRGVVGTALPAPNLLEAVAWLPVGALALVDLARAPTRRAVALLAAATAMSLLAGYPQPTVYVVYAWGSLFLALLIQARPSVRDAVPRVAAFAAALALGALVAAVQMVPAAELMAAGVRAARALTDQTMFRVNPTLTPATAILYGRSIAGTAHAVGLVALALVPAALLAPGRRVLGIWSIAVAALSAAWALGRGTPFFDLYLALPGLALFRNPARILIVTDFAVAIAAALGLAAVTGRTDDAEARPRQRIAALVVAAVALVLLVDLTLRGWSPRSGRVAVFAVAALGVLAALWRAPASWRPRVAGAAAIVAAIEITGHPTSEFRLPYGPHELARLDALAPDMRELRRRAGHDRVWRAVTGIQIEHAIKLSTRHRVRSITDYEPVNLRRQADFFTYFRDGSTTARRKPWLFAGDIPDLDAPPAGAPPATRRRLLDLAAVRFIALKKNALVVPAIATFVRDAALARRPPTNELLVFENPGALPRAFVTYRARTAPDDPDALLAAMSVPSFDPLVESFVEGPPPFAPAPGAPARGDAATFVRDDDTVVELEATLARPGLVVLADAFHPGWHATVDGEPAPILATNHLFRGVPAPAGTHRIRFVYAPASVRLGGIASLLGLAVVAWLAAGRRRRLSPQ